MTLFDLLKRPICYKTLEVKESLLKCTRCKCAWYSSKHEQKAHWPIHKKVCKEPEYDMVKSLSADQCYRVITRTLGSKDGIDHNTAAILEQMHYLVRRECERNRDGDEEDSKMFANIECMFCDWKQGESCGKTIDMGMDLYERLDQVKTNLHTVARVSQRAPFSLDKYYERAWAAPGMPQFLLFTNLSALSYCCVKEKFPMGRPIFDTKEADEKFDEQFSISRDRSGEFFSWHVISFLTRSCVTGSISMNSADDGVTGDLRTTPFANAAKRRLCQIFSTPELRRSARETMHAIPGFLLNLANHNPQEFAGFLNEGLFSGITDVEWAGEKYSLELFNHIEAKLLTEESKLSIIELGCDVYDRWNTVHFRWHPFSDSEAKEFRTAITRLVFKILVHTPDIVSFLEHGITRQATDIAPEWKDWILPFGSRRMIFAYLLDKVTGNNEDLEFVRFTKLLKSWKLTKLCDRTGYAQRVMNSEVFGKWMKRTEKQRSAKPKGETKTPTSGA